MNASDRDRKFNAEKTVFGLMGMILMYCTAVALAFLFGYLVVPHICDYFKLSNSYRIILTVSTVICLILVNTSTIDHYMRRKPIETPSDAAECAGIYCRWKLGWNCRFNNVVLQEKGKKREWLVTVFVEEPDMVIGELTINAKTGAMKFRKGQK